MSSSKTPKLNWFRFRLRTALIALTVFSIVLGVWASRASRQRKASRWAEQYGATVEFGFEFRDNDRRQKEGEPPVPGWLLEVLDIHYFSNVVNVNGVKPSDDDLAPLAEFTHLRYLTIDSTPNNDALRHLSKLSELRSLTFASPEKISDLSPLASLNLKVLHLESSQVDDLTPLANHINLERLKITDAKFGDIGPLSRLQNIEELNLGGSAIRDLKPLARLSKLWNLDVSDTNVDDLTPLVGLTNLQRLNLSSTLIDDISPLEKLPNLEFLGLKDVKINDAELKKLKLALPNCRISN